MSPVVIVSAVRTPIGAFQGALASVSAPRLGAAALRGALERAGLPASEVKSVHLGQVLQAGCGQAPARQAAWAAGIPSSVPCTTVNKVCGSGLESIWQAARVVAAGEAAVVDRKRTSTSRLQ